MKAKQIFYSWALMAVAMMLFTLTACSSDDNLTENKIETPAVAKDYTIPVTVKVSHQGENAATRASYDESTKTLSFSTGDQLFIQGTESNAGAFAGTLTYASTTDDASTFTGDIYTTNSYSGTADDLLTAASSSGSVSATLLPNEYGTYGYLSVTGSGSSAVLAVNAEHAIIGLIKSLAVEQFTRETATSYDSETGFSLAPANAILYFNISDLKTIYSSESVTVSLKDGSTTYINKEITTSNIFIMAVPAASYTDLQLNITYGNTVKTISLGDKEVAATKIYNIVKTIDNSKLVNLASVTEDTEITDGSLVTGTLDVEHYPKKISIKAGANVTLKDVTINGTKNVSYTWAGITCEGSATINLEGTNTVKGFDRNYPGLYVPSGSTLTIQSPSGTGKLTASSNGYGSGIGGGFNISCGNIVIESGIITATGGSNCTGIGNGYAADGTSECGYITINGGNVTANGGDNGAGIGCGYALGTSQTTSSKCGIITINGGTVTATVGQYGAGIGCGYAYGSRGVASSECGAISIKDGTVIATGGTSAAGIGSGPAYHNQSEATSKCGAITISGGTVTATGKYKGAGIGGGEASGNDGTAKSICESITINGGTGQIQVTATKGENAIDCIGQGFTNQGGNFVSGVTGIISIGGTTYWTGSVYENGGAEYLGKNSLTYPSSSN